MARIVMKFGGTSVGDLDRIRNVARRVKAAHDDGHEVAVVVSAMSGETNRLVGLVSDAAPLYDTREYDVVVSTGEQVTVGVLSVILQSMGVDARSWLGWQLPFQTEDVHGNARILDIDTSEIERGALILDQLRASVERDTPVLVYGWPDDPDALRSVEHRGWQVAQRACVMVRGY